jgi:glutaminase
MYRVGLPAKSGVSGGIIAVLPGQVGLGLFSPRLDEVGNSVRGVRACREFTSSFNLHLFDAHPTSDTVVRRFYRGSDLPSQRVRRREHRQAVHEVGRTVQVYELQGDLFFGSAERVVRVVENALDGVRYVVLDAEHVGRTDASALGVIYDLGAHLAAHDAELVLAGFPPKWIDLVSTDEHPWAVRRFPTASAALEWAEDDALASHHSIDLHATRVPPDQVDILHDVDPEALAELTPYLRVAKFGDRDALVAQGEPADAVYFLVEGRAEVFVRVAGRPKRIRSYDAGVAFGELALFEQQLRSADVVADGPVTCLVLDLDDVLELRDRRPRAYQQLLVAAGRNLADLILRQTRDLAAG